MSDYNVRIFEYRLMKPRYVPLYHVPCTEFHKGLFCTLSITHSLCRLRYQGGGTEGRELTFLFIEIERKIALEVKLSCLSTL